MQTPKIYSPKTANRKKVEIFLDFLEKNEFLAVDVRWVICFYLAKYFGLLSHSGKALDDDFDLHVHFKLYRSHKRRNDEDFLSRSDEKNWEEFIAGHKHKHERGPSNDTYRYELIDFPCSLHSFDLADFLFAFIFSISDDLHENCSPLKPVHSTKSNP